MKSLCHYITQPQHWKTVKVSSIKQPELKLKTFRWCFQFFCSVLLNLHGTMYFFRNFGLHCWSAFYHVSYSSYPAKWWWNENIIKVYLYTTWTLIKRLEKKLDGNYTRMLQAILNRSWRQHPTRHQLYGHLPPITKTIQVRWTRLAGRCWRSRDGLKSDVHLWTPTHGWAKAGRPAWTYIQQLCEDTGCSPEDLPEAMNDSEKWRERVRDIHAGGTTQWWWYIHYQSKVFGHPQKFLFLILSIIFKQKQIKHHNVQ